LEKHTNDLQSFLVWQPIQLTDEQVDLLINGGILALTTFLPFPARFSRN
jgi:hypothetical protein